MSVSEIKRIIEKMIDDENFEKEIFENPNNALSDFDLTNEEREQFLALDREQLKKISMNLDKRLSKDDSWWVDSIND